MMQFLERSKLVATAPTACGIETMQQRALAALNQYNVATAPTACGIETLPPLVLLHHFLNGKLQQHLPLAVLKPDAVVKFHDIGCVATAPTACGIETPYFFLSSANNS